jgi:hypothetical protein
LADAGGVEADHLETAGRHCGFKWFGEVEAGADAGDQEQRIAVAADPDPQPDPVDLDEVVVGGFRSAGPGSVRRRR